MGTRADGDLRGDGGSLAGQLGDGTLGEFLERGDARLGVGALLAKVATVEGVRPEEARVADGTDVVAKEQADLGLARLQRDEARRDENGNSKKHEAPNHHGNRNGGRLHSFSISGSKHHDAPHEANDGGQVGEHVDDEHRPA